MTSFLIVVGILVVVALAIAALKRHTTNLVQRRLSKPARVEALHEAKEVVLPPDDFLNFIAAGVKSQTKAAISFCTFIYPDRQYIMGSSGIAIDAPSVSKEGILLEDSVCRLVVADNGPVDMADMRKLPHMKGCAAVKDGFVSYYGEPIKFKGEILGAVGVCDTKPREWTENEKKNICHAADIVSHAITERAMQAA